MQGFKARASGTGMARLRVVSARFGSELRVARLAAGLTQRQAAIRAAVSQTQVGSAEAGDPGISLAVRCRLAAAVGHEVALRLYPISSVPLRDSGQLRLAQRIADAASSHRRIRLEVPTGPGSLRAADMILESSGEIIHVEIERALVDFQAQLRSAQVKRAELADADHRPVRLVFAVPMNIGTRRILGEHRALVGEVLPASSRRIWRALRTGAPVGQDGLLLLH